MNNLPFISCEADFDESEIVLFGVPFDGTVSNRPGTRFAPNRIRIESDAIETYSPYQNSDLENYKIHDAGDIPIPHGNTKKTLDFIETQMKSILSTNKKPLMIGGEHLITYPAIKALQTKHPNLHVIHFDAHTDLRESLYGETLSHATVMKRVCELLGDNRLFQFGIRSGLKEEFEYSKKHQYIEIAGVSTITQIAQKLHNVPIYISLDVDVLDPSIMPGTGTPEAGGLFYKELLSALLSLKSLHIVGADIVELSPDYDHSGASTAVAATLIRELLLLLAK
jgi:agmatinase